jgi:hypothetical protein
MYTVHIPSGLDRCLLIEFFRFTAFKMLHSSKYLPKQRPTILATFLYTQRLEEVLF